MNSHAQVPTPLVCDGFIRIYFSSRPQRNLSLTSFVDVDTDDPQRIIRLNEKPILALGKPGTFDEHGIMPSSALRVGKDVYLYYSGWSRRTTVPYTNSMGLAVSHDEGCTFEKISEGPILTKGLHDPFSATSPVVLKKGDLWHMWYCSGTGWLRVAGKYEHTYDIKYACSRDGIRWDSAGKIALPQLRETEALTRPYVVSWNDSYHMWFCYRGSHSFRGGSESYRIGFAYSKDTENWIRSDDDAGIERSTCGWNSEMIAYPAVVNTGEHLVMFYNGNDFGADGFGFAIRS